MPPFIQFGGFKRKSMARKVTRHKECYCWTCDKDFHYLGINMHRAMHRKRNEDCKITYTHGDTKTFRFSLNKNNP